MVKNVMEESALWYRNVMDFSVIPTGRDKKPLIKWEEYQKRKATVEEIHEWFKSFPSMNIGIVTGKVSNLAVIDIDDKEIRDESIDAVERTLIPPTCLTPRGGRHLYFKFPDMASIRNAVSIIPKVDIRGEGGYVVAPPSVNLENKKYSWLKNKSIDKRVMQEFPLEMIKAQEIDKPSYVSTGMFKEGSRDNDLFHLANIMVKGGATPSECREALTRLARLCDPPYPESEISIKIESAMKRAEKRERNISEEVKRWVDIQDGYFDINTMYRDLSIQATGDRAACYTAVSRLIKEGTIEKYGKKAGNYRIPQVDIVEMDWRSAPDKELDIKYPLRIEDLMVTYPSNIIILAGASNSGKTTFLLDFARLNCKKNDIHYFNSEMGEGELRMRLGLFENMKQEGWNRVKFYERSENFDDVIRPDSINIIDYLEVLKDFWMVGEQIKAIHDKLTTGIAVIAIQKGKGVELGRGGSFGTEKPRLYIAMDYGRAKIIKAKNWRSTENPNGMECQFGIAGGWKFIEKGGWKAKEDEDTKKDQGGRALGQS